jgi:hypothetical protein
MSDFQRQPRPFASKGLALRSDATLQQPDRYRRLLNVRPLVDGTFEAREGLTKFTQAALGGEAHSLRRLNALDGTYVLVAGAGTKLFEISSGGISTERDSAWPGTTLSLVPYRPENSPETWVYAASTSRMRKLKSGLTRNMGIAPPANQITTALEIPQYTIGEELDVVTGWATGGTASAITLQTRAASSAIVAVLWETGAAGWGIFTLAITEAWQAGMRVLINKGGGTAQYATVDRVMTAPALVNRVRRIAFDSGSTGWATITFSHSSTGVTWDPVIQLNSPLAITDAITSERVWVRGIIDGPDDQHCVRVFFTGNHPNFSLRAPAGLVTVSWETGIRLFTGLTHAAGETVELDTLQFKVSNELGWIQKVKTLDFSWMQTGGLGRQTGRDDYIHVSFKIDLDTKLTQATLYLDCASDSVSAGVFTATAFTKNYFYVQWGLTDLSSPRGASNQYSELFFHLSDLVRVGTDRTRTLKDIVGIRLELRVANAPAGTDAVIQVNSLYIRGGFGPDFTSTALPFQYRYRGRSSATGAKSNASPVNLAQVNPPLRGRIKLTLTQHPDGQVDKLDVFRFGGGINEWRYVGTTENGATPTFNDEANPTDTASGELLDEDQDQPFPLADLSRQGHVNVTGIALEWKDGDQFNLSWKPGAVIFVDKLAFVVHSVLTATLLLLTESAGFGENVSFSLPSPILMGQALPAVWGPHEGSLYGCAGSSNPGFLSWTKGNDADAAPEAFTQEVTQGAGEPLVNGFVHDTRNFVFSSDHLYAIYPSPTGDRRFLTIYRTACGRGLWARFAWCLGGGKIWFLSKDGIYVTDGGPSESITDDDLYPLFPHEGSAGIQVNEHFPVDMTKRNYLRLAYHDEKLYFDYRDTANAPRTFVYIPGRGWVADLSNPPLLGGLRYSSEGDGVHDMFLGALDGHIHKAGGETDDGAEIPCVVRTFSDDGGDPVAKKLLGDAALNVDPGGKVLTPLIKYDDEQSSVTLATITGSGRAQYRLDINSGAGLIVRNAALEVTWLGRGPRLHSWELAYIQKPEDQQRRLIDWQPFAKGGLAVDSYVYGIRLWVDTFGVAKTVEVWKDQVDTGITLTVNSNGEKPLEFTWAEFIGHLGRLVPTDANPWRVTGFEWFTIPAPPLLTLWRTTANSLGLQGFGHIFRIYVPLISTSAVTLRIVAESGTEDYTIAATAGVKQKRHVMFRPNKGRLYDFEFSSSAGFRLFRDEAEVYVKNWGDEGPYRIVKPFGGGGQQGVPSYGG